MKTTFITLAISAAALMVAGCGHNAEEKTPAPPATTNSAPAPDHPIIPPNPGGNGPVITNEVPTNSVNTNALAVPGQ